LTVVRQVFVLEADKTKLEEKAEQKAEDKDKKEPEATQQPAEPNAVEAEP